MKFKIFASLLLAFLFCLSSYGQNYKFIVKTDNVTKTKTVSTSESLTINPTSSSLISLKGDGGIITFNLYTEDDILLMLAKALDIPNKKYYDLPFEIELSNGTIIKWKTPSLNYIKFTDYNGGELALAYGLTPSCSFEISLSCLNTMLGGNTIEKQKYIFQNLLKENDIKRIVINLGDGHIIPINFLNIKTSFIISKMLTM